MYPCNVHRSLIRNLSLLPKNKRNKSGENLVSYSKQLPKKEWKILQIAVLKMFRKEPTSQITNITAEG